MEGRTVIITGGSGGIGRGCARAFAQAGANVVIASVPEETIPSAVEEVEALGAQALGVRVNVADPAEIDVMVQQTLDNFGRIDALLNVAGGSYSRNPDMPQYSRAPLLEMDGDDFVGAYIGNVKTAFLVSRAVVPHMKKIGKGPSSTSARPPGWIVTPTCRISPPMARQRLRCTVSRSTWPTSGSRRCGSTASRPERSTRLALPGSCARRWRRQDSA